MRIIIVGAGEVGFHVARRLAMENKEVVVVDKDSESLRRVSEATDVQTIQGSGCSPRVLEQAGIREADILLAVTDADEINLIACFFANTLAPKATKLARIRSEEYTEHKNLLTHGNLGIAKIINPDQEVVDAILRLISVPGAVEINEFAGGKIRLIGLIPPEWSPVLGVKLVDLHKVIGHIPVVMAALVRNGQIIVPRGDDRILRGDTAYIACEITDQDEILERFGIQVEPIRSVLIVGGGNIGYKLAKSLDNKYFHTRIVERDAERCRFLSEHLDRPIVLYGNGTDQELLTEENVGQLDLVVAVTGDEEINILSCLLAKTMGARQTITRINNFAYMPLTGIIGIDHLVSPRLSAINSLLHYIRRGKVVSTASIQAEDAEVLEAIAQEKSRVAGKAIKDIHFPKGALVLCFQRGQEVIIPRGDTVIHPGDRMVILSTRANISKVEQALDVTMEFMERHEDLPPTGII